MVDKLLVALWHAEFQCRYGLYRTGLIMLADISMEFGLSQKAQRMVEDIMPQVISKNSWPEPGDVLLYRSFKAGI
jgi:anaphase-promoting complex subunit 5